MKLKKPKTSPAQVTVSKRDGSERSKSFSVYDARVDELVRLLRKAIENSKEA
jgi:hypothetical protein